MRIQALETNNFINTGMCWNLESSNYFVTNWRMQIHFKDRINYIGCCCWTFCDDRVVVN